MICQHGAGPMRFTVAGVAGNGRQGRVGGRPKGLGLTIRGPMPDQKNPHSQFGNFAVKSYHHILLICIKNLPSDAIQNGMCLHNHILAHKTQYVK
jgi:hypothetical protein